MSIFCFLFFFYFSRVCCSSGLHGLCLCVSLSQLVTHMCMSTTEKKTKVSEVDRDDSTCAFFWYLVCLHLLVLILGLSSSFY